MSTEEPQKCPLPAHYRYTWPGRDESWICAAHAPKLAGVASAMGLHLQMIQLDVEEIGVQTCRQTLSAKESEALAKLVDGEPRP